MEPEQEQHELVQANRSLPSTRLPQPNNPNSPLRPGDNALAGPGVRRLNELNIPEIETVLANRFNELARSLDHLEQFIGDDGQPLLLTESQERAIQRRLATTINFYNVVIRLADYLDSRLVDNGTPLYDRRPLIAAHQLLVERMDANDARFRQQHPDTEIPDLPKIARQQLQRTPEPDQSRAEIQFSATPTRTR